ncbi:MAG: HNH endonuclease [Promethearchaeota archaeon]
MHPECKKCRKEKVKIYYEKNKAKILEQKKEYHKANRDNICAKKKIYNKENSEKRSEWGTKYYIDNKELLLKKTKKWYYENLEKSLATAKKNKHKRKSLLKKVEATLTTAQWTECKIYFGNKCCYCGIGANLHQEHFIPLANGGEYTKNNIIPACGKCNSSKCDKDFFEWYPKQSFYNKKKEQKILKYLNYDKKTKTQQLALI